MNGGVASKVGSRSANPFGLYDMHGNVIELARGADPFARRGGQAGGWAQWAHSARRVYTAAASAASGFRVAIVGDLTAKTPLR